MAQLKKFKNNFYLYVYFSTDPIFKIFLASHTHFLIKKLTGNIKHLPISSFNMQIINASPLVAAYWKMWLYAMQVQEKR